MRHIAGQKGLVKPQLRPFGVDDLLGYRALCRRTATIMAPLPAARIMAKDRKVMPSSTGISCKKRLPIYLFVQNGYPL